MGTRFVGFILAGAAAILLAGCYGTHIGKVNVDMPTIDTQGLPEFAQEFRQCVERPGGTCRGVEPDRTVAQRLDDVANAADYALKEDMRLPCDGVTLDEQSRSTLESVSAARNILAPALQQVAGGTAQVHPRLSEFRRLVKGLHQSLLQDGWKKTNAALASKRVTCKAADDVARIGDYVQAYFRAYFKNGQFIQFGIKGVADVKDKLAKEIAAETGLDMTKATAIADQIIGNVKDPVFGKFDDSAAFVTRGGDSYKAPLITADLTPFSKKKLSVTQIDTTALVADLARVFLEAVFDAVEGLPAVSTATGVTALKESPLPANNPSMLIDTTGGAHSQNLCEANFARVEAWGTRSEAMTTVGVGMLIRGGGVFALNNERAATLVETAFGVTARKLTEKIAWCFLACTQLNSAHPDDSCKPSSDELALLPLPQKIKAIELMVDHSE
jgi:hypothetical protein